ncbi:23S rRNA (adenine(2503)-C(2))-methyltransferase RlmN [uncultured Methylovirgula sp.]|uniref:23S rRNA (adenine(2503)-C(2))-methyltransferase RlmN n=1 Tax=uncultured Methylovirgula sp. TaxID=1285960 RepID=UPI0026250ADA|nr:23S rRNA (adenine(2503)-C(2))-methyltransferase RlmN [uncultured Methylovirgula sp.]
MNFHAETSPSSLPVRRDDDATLTSKASLVGATRAELAEALRTHGVTEREIKMRVAQLWHWLYFQGARDFDAMLNIGKGLRSTLAAHESLARPEVVSEQVSQDGTRKWLLRLAPVDKTDKGAEVECVYIPESDRGTLCISSQVGCTLTCRFCHTGTQKLVRNLTTREIVAQIIVARERLGDFPGLTPPTNGLLPQGETRPITNIVFMGMGEPLYNFDNVRDAVGVLADGDGLSVSKRRITVSTAGVVPQIERLGAEAGPMLAISLHAVRDDLRDTLVPLNKKYPIKDLLAACRDYPGASNARRITFEYVMLKGVNDSPAEARELVRLLKGIPAKINLIPFNPWPGTQYECSDWDKIEAFSDIVFDAGYASPVRTPRGRDILAACGQLKSETEKLRARARLAAEAE